MRYAADPDGIITGGHDNKTARTMAVREGETINAPALTAMFWQIIASNRAGGWRKLKPDVLIHGHRQRGGTRPRAGSGGPHGTCISPAGRLHWRAR